MKIDKVKKAAQDYNPLNDAEKNASSNPRLQKETSQITTIIKVL